MSDFCTENDLCIASGCRDSFNDKLKKWINKHKPAILWLDVIQYVYETSCLEIFVNMYIWKNFEKNIQKFSKEQYITKVLIAVFKKVYIDMKLRWQWKYKSIYNRI